MNEDGSIIEGRRPQKSWTRTIMILQDMDARHRRRLPREHSVLRRCHRGAWQLERNRKEGLQRLYEGPRQASRYSYNATSGPSSL